MGVFNVVKGQSRHHRAGRLVVPEHDWSSSSTGHKAAARGSLADEAALLGLAAFYLSPDIFGVFSQGDAVALLGPHFCVTADVEHGFLKERTPA
jgi:hypothetical protein